MIQKFEEVKSSRPTKCSLLYDKINPISKILKIEAMRVFPAKRFFGQYFTTLKIKKRKIKKSKRAPNYWKFSIFVRNGICIQNRNRCRQFFEEITEL